jgi:hypothetical protein
MLVEVTPKMAAALMSSPARRILLPLSQQSVEIVSMQREPLPHLVQTVFEAKRIYVH